MFFASNFEGLKGTFPKNANELNNKKDVSKSYEGMIIYEQQLIEFSISNSQVF